jgi:hypothetical protein
MGKRMSEKTVEPAVSAVKTTSKGGRPTKYEPETTDRLLVALADGLTLKQVRLFS